MNGEILGTRTPGGDSGIMSGVQMPAGYTGANGRRYSGNPGANTAVIRARIYLGYEWQEGD